MSFDTWPKKEAETAAWIGLANANARSRLTRVAVVEASDETVPRLYDVDGRADELSGIGWKRHVVVSSLKSGVEEDATAWTDSSGMQVTLLT